MSKIREAIYTGSEEELERLDEAAAALGIKRGAKVVVGDNGIIAEYCHGAELTKHLQDLWDGRREGREPRQWDEMSGEQKFTVMSVAAGSVEYAMDGTVSNHALEHRPESEMIDALYHPAPEQANAC